jgi:hypothetical protein
LRFPTIQRIADGLTEGALGQHPRAFSVEPGFERLENRNRHSLTLCATRFGRGTFRLQITLDLVELAEPIEGIPAPPAIVRSRVMKLPPRYRHARNLGDASPAVNRPVSGKSVGLQVSAIPFQEPERPISRAGFRVVEDGAFVSNVDPESALLRPLLLFAFFARRLFHSAFGIQHAHLGVVGEDPRALQDLRL